MNAYKGEQLPELRDLSYEERLMECGLTTLETRRLRGDQIEVFKVLNEYENIYRNMFFSLKKDSRTRGHEVKLVKDQCRLNIRKYSFSQRTVNEWNKLSTDCITTSSVNMFKNKVDTYLRRPGYMKTNPDGLSISQWLPCPLAIWAFVKSGRIVICSTRWCGHTLCPILQTAFSLLNVPS